MLRISLKWFLVLAALIGGGSGMAIRLYTLPFKIQLFFANGQVSREWWEQRRIGGGVRRLWNKGATSYYSNGVKSSELYNGDERLSRYYSPDGNPITAERFYDYYFRDLGDGTFAQSVPHGHGRESPLAQEYTERPLSHEY